MISIRFLRGVYGVVVPDVCNLSPMYPHNRLDFWEKPKHTNKAIYLPVLEWLYETR